MAEPLKTYSGTLRPCITIIGPGQIKIQWVNADGVTIWTETAKPWEGHAFASQITCTGEFSVSNTFMVDTDGKRHFVLTCDPGRLGAKM